ncbi:MAG: bifunctional homocysteine S-methyltransferase/methylenetetrahydrofolate reductase [Armatimonadetes bacterium]|nr:bifunctional homocysteine S-methyltransferase/methylenetetrahydrofolate reductase [Armatimonadota bacterium]MCX7968969.1 bifunctional homocysteine S-methyltransferase/methylenetetrahydrofolate reductase [Armatimonadota bacterium]MDW8143436.1 bifunctional homocysteine S-methyltransferase/methylenetetrahydrofolate reductase [Armatimonadota bacterium]
MPAERGRKLLARLRETIVIGDGAMGTELWRRGFPQGLPPEQANLTAPDLVKSVHRDYLSVGAQVLTTNTFAANPLRLRQFGLEKQVRELVTTAVRLAKEVISESNADAFIAGSVGPIGQLKNPLELSDEDLDNAYRELVLALADAGVDLLVFETFVNLEDLRRAIKVAKQVTDLPIIAQLAAIDDAGRGTEGRAALAIFELEKLGIDAIGTNCGVSPIRNLAIVRSLARLTELPITASPNLGFAQYVDGRFVYIGEPQEFARIGEEIWQSGANLIGGCCGTTPEHIRLLVERLKGKKPQTRIARRVEVKPEEQPKLKSPIPNFLSKVGDEPIIIVELDPPRGLDYEPILEGAKTLARAGVDAISIGDNSLASIRLSNLVMAHLIQRETGLPTICHFAGRDHNLIGAQSLLMGMAVLGIPAVLAVTGDPAKLAPDVGASSVYDLNSFQIMELLSKLNRGVNWVDAPIGKRTDFIIGAGFNPNVHNLDAEVKRLKRKVEKGAQFALTQAVFEPERIKACGEVMKEVGIPIFVGIGILISARNASFWKTVPGVKMPDEILKRMESVPKEKQLSEGITIARELIEVALENCPGVFLIPPFSRAEYALPLVEFVRSK